MGIIFGSRTTQPGGSHCAANIVEGVTPGCSNRLEVASPTPPPPPIRLERTHTVPCRYCATVEAVVDGWRLPRTPFLPSRRSSHSGGQYKSRRLPCPVEPVQCPSSPTGHPRPPLLASTKKRETEGDRARWAATDTQQQGGSGTKIISGFQRLLWQNGTGLFSKVPTGGPAPAGRTEGQVGQIKLSAPAQRRLLVAPRMRRARARPVGRLANKLAITRTLTEPRRWKATGMFLARLPSTVPCHVCAATRDLQFRVSSESSQPLWRILIPTVTLPHGNPPIHRAARHCAVREPSLDRCNSCRAWCESGGRGGSARQAGSSNREILEDLDPACRRRPPPRHGSVVFGKDLRPLQATRAIHGLHTQYRCTDT